MKIILLAVVSLFVGTVVFIGIGQLNDNGTANVPSQEEIKLVEEEFDCDRTTLDIRETDRYCIDPSLYFEDFKNGKTDTEL